MITALCGQAGGITKSGKPCRIRVSDSGRLCMAHDPQHRKNGLLAEDGDRNVTQTITDGIIKGIGDGPAPGHHETVEHNPYILTPPPEGGPALTRKPDGGIHALDLDKVITAEFDDAQWLIEPDHPGPPRGSPLRRREDREKPARARLRPGPSPMRGNLSIMMTVGYLLSITSKTDV